MLGLREGQQVSFHLRRPDSRGSRWIDLRNGRLAVAVPDIAVAAGALAEVHAVGTVGRGAGAVAVVRIDLRASLWESVGWVSRGYGQE